MSKAVGRHRKKHQASLIYWVNLLRNGQYCKSFYSSILTFFKNLRVYLLNRFMITGFPLKRVLSLWITCHINMPHGRRLSLRISFRRCLKLELFNTITVPMQDVILVKKKDKSWRMSVDYKGQNAITIKDKFSIPLIEELREELGGSTVFSKLDLRAGYWQVKMKPNDGHKTRFRTHEGHYEFLVMPFGLTNALSTFSSLMNVIFKPYLKKFILVFFDDLLMYSRSSEKLLMYLQAVLNIMRTNQLYAKPSKCHFT